MHIENGARHVVMTANIREKLMARKNRGIAVLQGGGGGGGAGLNLKFFRGHNNFFFGGWGRGKKKGNSPLSPPAKNE